MVTMEQKFYSVTTSSTNVIPKPPSEKYPGNGTMMTTGGLYLCNMAVDNIL